MKIRQIQNFSYMAQDAWSEPFTLPKDLFPGGVANITAHGKQLGVAVRTMTRGPIAQWVAKLALGPSQLGTDELEMVEPTTPVALPPWGEASLHPAIEQIQDIVPGQITIGGGRMLAPQARVVRSSPAHIDGMLTWKAGGYRIDYRVRAYWRSPICPWSITIRWCPHDDPRQSVSADQVVIEFLEQCHVPLGFARGIESGVGESGHDVRLQLGVAQKGSVYIVRGMLLCSFLEGEVGDVGSDLARLHNENLRPAHEAAIGGPIVVTPDPEVKRAFMPWGFAEPCRQFRMRPATPGPYGQPRHEPSMRSHQTGDAGGYGVKKGYSLLYGSPFQRTTPIHYERWDIVDDEGLQRVHWLDENGELDRKVRPDLMTYEGYFKQGGNRFWHGSTPPQAPCVTGRDYHDEEHEHNLALPEIYSHTLDDVEHELVVDQQHWSLHDARQQSRQGTAGMHRAHLRRVQTAAFAAHVLEGEERDLAVAVRDGWLFGIRKAWEANPYGWTFRNSRGQETAMIYMGLMAAGGLVEVARAAGDTAFAARLIECIKVQVAQGLTWRNGVWQVPWYVVVGSPPWAGEFDPNYEPGASLGLMNSASMTAYLVLRDDLLENDPTNPMLTKVQAIIAQEMPHGVPETIEQWRWCTRKVTP